jgi:hypothetical protein
MIFSQKIFRNKVQLFIGRDNIFDGNIHGKTYKD